MALLEIRHRQAQQMPEQASPHLKRQCPLRIGQQPGADQGRAGVDQQEQREAERQHEKEVVVVFGDCVVDDDLHVERGREHIELQHEGENNGLDQGWREARDPPKEIKHRELGCGPLRAECLVRGQL